MQRDVTNLKRKVIEFSNCKEVPSRRKLVLTSLQGAWHNHGQRTHCMVRSSTMGSWAKTERYIRSQGVQLEIRHSGGMEKSVSKGRKWVKRNVSVVTHPLWVWWCVRTSLRTNLIVKVLSHTRRTIPWLESYLHWGESSKSRRSPKVWGRGRIVKEKQKNQHMSQ